MKSVVQQFYYIASLGCKLQYLEFNYEICLIGMETPEHI